MSNKDQVMSLIKGAAKQAADQGAVENDILTVANLVLDRLDQNEKPSSIKRKIREQIDTLASDISGVD